MRATCSSPVPRSAGVDQLLMLLAPLAVAPEYQGQGIGSALTESALERGRRRGRRGSARARPPGLLSALRVRTGAIARARSAVPHSGRGRRRVDGGRAGARCPRHAERRRACGRSPHEAGTTGASSRSVGPSAVTSAATPPRPVFADSLTKWHAQHGPAMCFSGASCFGFTGEMKTWSSAHASSTPTTTAAPSRRSASQASPPTPCDFAQVRPVPCATRQAMRLDRFVERLDELAVVQVVVEAARRK